MLPKCFICTNYYTSREDVNPPVMLIDCGTVSPLIYHAKGPEVHMLGHVICLGCVVKTGLCPYRCQRSPEIRVSYRRWIELDLTVDSTTSQDAMCAAVVKYVLHPFTSSVTHFHDV